MPSAAATPGTLLNAIQRFLTLAREPVAIEAGQPPFPLIPGTYDIQQHQGRLTFEVWDDQRHLSRTVTAIRTAGPARLELEVRRFPNKTGTILLFDQARAANHSLKRRAERHVFREQFRTMLARNFPGWKLAELSSEPDLQHSLSPAHCRALLKRGRTGWAALASPDDPHGASAALSFGLIWLDYLRRRERKLTLQGLVLFLPAGRELPTCLRLRCLHPRAAQFSVFLYGQDNWEQQVDPSRHGNLETVLPPASSDQAERRLAMPGPEAELERRIRANLTAVDGLLLPRPVYGQVPAVAGIDRGIIDLLGASCDGRLAVLELKATADLHLPLQALDYWMRVRWHAEHGEFAAAGYFPGLAVQPAPPRLLLVAPALEFHPTSETILRYFSPEIEVERVGLAVEWQREIRVVFRLRGAQSP
ncbi:MAG: hypothetical protein FJW20_03870 [Acidimicrobiia bacterium]|nr:hypothetical protein [Acidimicrobiia bacterium]